MHRIAVLRADPRARVVVVGGGLTGLELAAEVTSPSRTPTSRS